MVIGHRKLQLFGKKSIPWNILTLLVLYLCIFHVPSSYPSLAALFCTLPNPQAQKNLCIAHDPLIYCALDIPPAAFLPTSSYATYIMRVIYLFIFCFLLSICFIPTVCSYVDYMLAICYPYYIQYTTYATTYSSPITPQPYPFTDPTTGAEGLSVEGMTMTTMAIGGSRVKGGWNAGAYKTHINLQ